jgi:hypothetical protein
MGGGMNECRVLVDHNGIEHYEMKSNGAITFIMPDDTHLNMQFESERKCTWIQYEVMTLPQNAMMPKSATYNLH